VEHPTLIPDQGFGLVVAFLLYVVRRVFVFAARLRAMLDPHFLEVPDSLVGFLPGFPGGDRNADD
jgi:hypothetical protein